MAIIRANQLADGATLDADICIVGAGAAGITLARALEKSGFRICLLESGDYHPDEKVQSLYDLQNEGYPIRENFMSRARYFGGSCNLWAGRNMRMSRIDFLKRDWVPNSGWPLSYEELEPYYQHAERVLGVPAFSRFTAVDAVPHIEPREKQLFVAEELDPTVALWGIKPMRFGKVNKTALRRSRSIDVYLNANVTEIVPTPDGCAVEHLAVRTLEGKQLTARARTFVLASGGLENARLLLVSRRQHPQGLGNHHDVVGRYFLDHPRAIHGRIRVNDSVSLPCLTGIPLADGKFQLGIALSEQEQRKARVLNSYVSLEPALSEMAEKQYGRSINVMKVLLRHGYAGKRTSLSRIDTSGARDLIYLLTPKEIMPHFLYRPYAMLKRKVRKNRSVGHLTLINFCEQVPDRDSRVTLSDKRDALGMNMLRLDWRVGEAERHSVRHLHQLIGNSVEQCGIGTLETSPESVAELQFTDASHHMGTTRMNDDAREGVVDRNCRVHGLDNLFMGGSSVFATAGHANPTLTIVALTLRLAEHLEQHAKPA
ncbi:MAG: GMC family oxidoreductase [Gammaproteobacteria bacterium]|nr:GMC family oxidoreductase [Gammaproteobacteria bacterium]